MEQIINVLIMEDDPMVSEILTHYIHQTKGYQVVGTARNGVEGLEKAFLLNPELILLDINMPIKDGLATILELRSGQIQSDVIVISAINDRNTIRKMQQSGAIDYLIKPFSFNRFQQSLERYYQYMNLLLHKEELNQYHIDSFFGIIDSNYEGYEKERIVDEIPKGLNKQTLTQILSFLKDQNNPISAEETAEAIGIARVTARRYLDFLQKINQVSLQIQYGRIGRPINRYILQENPEQETEFNKKFSQKTKKTITNNMY